MSLPCPTAAAACFSGMLLSLSVMFRRCLPEAMAPDVTRTIEKPRRVRSHISCVRASMIFKSRPSAPVRTAEPILIRIFLTDAIVVRRISFMVHQVQYGLRGLQSFLKCPANLHPLRRKTDIALSLFSRIAQRFFWLFPVRRADRFY